MAKYDFFISYSSKDKDIAFKIVTAIESAGYTCWIAPRNIPYGTPYASAIMEGIDECDRFIVLITKNSIQSNDVLNEVDNAHSVKKTIIPVRLTETPLSRELNYYLSRTQWLTLPSSKPEEIVKLLNIGLSTSPTPTPVPSPVPPRPIKRMVAYVIAAIIAIVAGMAIWWVLSDKSKDIDKDDTALATIEGISEEESDLDTIYSEENTITQSTTPIERSKPITNSEKVKVEGNQYAKYKPEQIKKLADSLYKKGEYVDVLPMCIYIADSIDNNYSNMVGHMYQYGQGVPQNPIMAIQWYKRISHYHSGAHDSLFALYEQLAKQCGNVGNNKDAAHWYEELGAQCMSEKKYKEAAHWYELGDKTGFLDPNCKYWLGYLYYHGQGITKDLKKAKDYWEQAAEKNIKAKEALNKYFGE